MKCTYIVKYLILVSIYNQTGIFMTDLNESPQCQISRKLVQWKSSLYNRMGGQVRGLQSIFPKFLLYLKKETKCINGISVRSGRLQQTVPHAGSSVIPQNYL